MSTRVLVCAQVGMEVWGGAQGSTESGQGQTLWACRCRGEPRAGRPGEHREWAGQTLWGSHRLLAQACSRQGVTVSNGPCQGEQRGEGKDSCCRLGETGNGGYDGMVRSEVPRTR